MSQKNPNEISSPQELSAEEIEKIVEKVVALQLENSGATVNRDAENLSGQKFFAVAIFPERTFFVKNQDFSDEKAEGLLKQKVLLFIKSNSDLLKFDECAIGSWLNTARNRIDFDISILIRDKKRAIEIGEEYNQEAIFDLRKLEIIELSGNGDIPHGKILLPDLERLRRIVEN